ncbi:MAG: hypothetical protein HY078_12105 [Elusimicrobia bacterium]|nr:hypothetical protein [Elusimicrobiota bacterium]
MPLFETRGRTLFALIGSVAFIFSSPAAAIETGFMRPAESTLYVPSIGGAPVEELVQHRPLAPQNIIAKQEIEAAQRYPKDKMIMSMEESRRWSILEDWHADFVVAPARKPFGKVEFIEYRKAKGLSLDFARSQVRSYDALIVKACADASRDPSLPDLVRSVMFMESALAGPAMSFSVDIITRVGGDRIRAFSYPPMRIKAYHWAALLPPGADFNNTEHNVKAGAILLARILARLREPSIAAAATVYSYTGAEFVSEYGGAVAYVHRTKPWTNGFGELYGSNEPPDFPPIGIPAP